jgi:hypothetical protein
MFELVVVKQQVLVPLVLLVLLVQLVQQVLLVLLVQLVLLVLLVLVPLVPLVPLVSLVVQTVSVQIQHEQVSEFGFAAGWRDATPAAVALLVRIHCRCPPSGSSS